MNLMDVFCIIQCRSSWSCRRCIFFLFSKHYLQQTPFQSEELVSGNSWIQTPALLCGPGLHWKVIFSLPLLSPGGTAHTPHCWLLVFLGNYIASSQFLLLQTWFQSSLCPDLLLWNVRLLFFFFTVKEKYEPKYIMSRLCACIFCLDPLEKIRVAPCFSTSFYLPFVLLLSEKIYALLWKHCT